MIPPHASAGHRRDAGPRGACGAAGAVHLCVGEMSEMGQQWSTTYQHMIHTDIIIIIRTILLNIRTSIIINTQVIFFMDHLETLSIPGHPELYGRSRPVRAPWVSGAFSRQDPVNCRADHRTNVATVQPEKTEKPNHKHIQPPPTS